MIIKKYLFKLKLKKEKNTTFHLALKTNKVISMIILKQEDLLELPNDENNENYHNNTYLL
jgi:hypothetical protein